MRWCSVGGGITGIGWEVGVLAGLLDEGVDLRNADAVIGTSAGSFVEAIGARFGLVSRSFPAQVDPEVRRAAVRG
ncbi:hypothetical protein GCM10027456_63730 [Kineosporia babensis]